MVISESSVMICFLNDKQIFESLGDSLIDLTKTKLVKIIEDVIEKTGHKNLMASQGK